MINLDDCYIDDELELTENLQSCVDHLKDGHCVDKIIANLLLQNDFLKDEYQRERQEAFQIKEDVKKAIEQIKFFREQINSTFDSFEVIDVNIDLFNYWRKDRVKNIFGKEE